MIVLKNGCAIEQEFVALVKELATMDNLEVNIIYILLERYNYMKKGIVIKCFITVFILIMSFSILSGCSRLIRLDFETSRDDKAFQDMLNKVLAAIDSGDKEGLKDLFAVSTIETNPNLDNQIDNFFQVYKGPSKIEHIDLQLYVSESTEYGRRKTELSDGGEDIIITASGVRYYVSMMMYSKDDFNKDNEGIHILEFDTEEAQNSQYFAAYNEEDDGPGLYYQDSVEQRDDIRWIEGRSWKYTHYDRKLTAEQLRAVADQNDDFDNFVSVIGKPNCSWTVYAYYYYELDNGLFAVCKVEDVINDVRPLDSSGYVNKPNSIVAIYISDEKDNLDTLWMAPDIHKVMGEYRYYRSVKRELSEDFFKEFVKRSHSLAQLEQEIGLPNIDEHLGYDCYYEIADNRYVDCHFTGNNIEEFSIVDSEDKLYTIWKEKSSTD